MASKQSTLYSSVRGPKRIPLGQAIAFGSYCSSSSSYSWGKLNRVFIIFLSLSHRNGVSRNFGLFLATPTQFFHLLIWVTWVTPSPWIISVRLNFISSVFLSLFIHLPIIIYLAILGIGPRVPYIHTRPLLPSHIPSPRFNFIRLETKDALEEY